MTSRVLVVDDEDDVTTGLGRALRAEGYAVDIAHDGRRGLDLALSIDYDVIVLDVMLPALNGYEVCRQVRHAGVRTPILMLSAKRGEWDIADGLDIGADDYLTKPFSVVELLARLRARSRGEGGAADRYSTGDLRFDPVTRRCRRGDDEVDLSAREALLLTALFEHVGTVVTKADLGELVWADRTVDPNAVEVYIGRLRRKLDVPYGTNDIETVRGIGYRLRGAFRSG